MNHQLQLPTIHVAIYPRLRVVGLFPLGVAVVVPDEAAIGTFSAFLPLTDVLAAGAFQ